MTTVYLAWSTSGSETLRRHVNDEPVDLLVAYPVLHQFLKVRADFNVRRWVLDSGAFSVFNSGAKINVEEYIATARDVDADEVFGLDVIGDPAQTRMNLDRMWSAGIKAIPTYHRGSPISELRWCAANADKVAFGGVARMPEGPKVKWLKQAMQVVWPKKVHAFGCAGRNALDAAPFHSADASSWVYAPQKMGAWAGYTGRQVALGARGIKDFWPEVVEHQKRARRAAAIWRADLELLQQQDKGDR